MAFESGSPWHLTVNAVKKFGLVITGASFQKSPTSPFIFVLFDGRLGEIFVPYHPGRPRYGDISVPGLSINGSTPVTLNPAQFPPPRQIIGGGKICKEVRDYLAYMNASTLPEHYNPGPLRPGSCLFFGAQRRQLCTISWNGRSVTTEPYWSGQARPGPSSAELRYKRPHA